MMWRIGTLVLAAGLSGALAYKIADRDIPVLVLEKKPERSAYHPGEMFRADYKFFRHRSCATKVHRLMWDSKGERYVIIDLTFHEGVLPLGHDRASVPALVPRSAAPGKAVYRTINCYQCNFTHLVWPVCDRPRDIEFEVLEGAVPDGSR